MCKECKTGISDGFLIAHGYVGYSMITNTFLAILLKDHKAMEKLRKDVPSFLIYDEIGNCYCSNDKGQDIADAILTEDILEEK